MPCAHKPETPRTFWRRTSAGARRESSSEKTRDASRSVLARDVARDPEVAQTHLAVRPGHRKDPGRRRAVVILLRQQTRRGPIQRNARRKREAAESAGSESDALPKADNGIKRSTHEATQRPSIERHRVGE